MRTLAPLLPKRGSSGPAVLTLQRWLNERGAGLVVDGDYGPATAAALKASGPPPARPLPPMGAWIDRDWVTDPARWARLASRIGLARVGLFLISADAGPPRVYPPHWTHFGTLPRLRGAIETFGAYGIDVDLTAWLWPDVDYTRAMLDTVGPLLEEYDTARLDGDTEFAFASAGEHERVAEMLTAVPASRMSVNDYASLQAKTRLLLRDGVRRRPQLYSVGYTKYTGSKVITQPGDLHYPGVTQHYGMAGGGRWHQVAAAGPLDVGLAAYKPVARMTVADQVMRQAAAALWYEPAELWWWQLDTGAAYHSALEQLGRAA